MLCSDLVLSDAFFPSESDFFKLFVAAGLARSSDRNFFAEPDLVAGLSAFLVAGAVAFWSLDVLARFVPDEGDCGVLVVDGRAAVRAVEPVALPFPDCKDLLAPDRCALSERLALEFLRVLVPARFVRLLPLCEGL